MDRETDRGRPRIPRLRASVVLPRRAVDGASRAGNYGTGPFAQGRERHAGHLPLDREARQRAGREGHVSDHLQRLGAGQRPHRGPDARGRPRQIRADPAPRSHLQRPFPPVAGAAAAGPVSPEVRRTAGRAAQHPAAAHRTPRQEQRVPLPESRRRIQHLLQRKTPLPADRSPETGHQRDPAGHRDGIPDEPPAARRCRQRQNPRGADDDAAGGLYATN